MCRSLKKLAKDDGDMKLLWRTVLNNTNGEHETITSTMIENTWNDLLHQSKVRGELSPKSVTSNQNRKRKMTIIEEEEKENQFQNVSF